MSMVQPARVHPESLTRCARQIGEPHHDHGDRHMDAQYSRNHGCYQHLQRHRDPADKQPHGNAARYRTSVQMPHHRLREGVSYPATHPCFLVLTTTQKLVQHAAHVICVGEFVLKPVCSHRQGVQVSGKEFSSALLRDIVKTTRLFNTSPSARDTSESFLDAAMGKSC